MAALSGIVTLVLLQLYRLWRKELSLAHSTGLALIGAIGFLVWFAIFNIFSLSSLNQDLPIPLFPVSPEDLCCTITVGFFVVFYEWFGSLYRKDQNSKQQAEILAAFLPIIVTLMVDVYLI